MTVGTRPCVGSSATAVPLLRLPEVDEAEPPGQQRPAEPEGPHVRRQVGGTVVVDHGEADQVHRSEERRVGKERRRRRWREDAMARERKAWRGSTGNKT